MTSKSCHTFRSLAAAATLACCSYAQTDAAKGLVLHLPLDGTVEPVVGKELGTPKVVGTPAFVEGRHGQAISLTNGVHLLVNLPPNVKNGEFTLAFWMKPLWHPEDDLPHPILEIPSHPESRDKVGWASGQFLVSKGWSDTISPNHFYGVVDAGLAKLHLKPNQWVHVVTSYSGSGKFRSSYVNGEGWRYPQTQMHPLDAHQNTMWLGCRDGGLGTADVILDDFRIYDRALGQEDVAAVAGVEFPPPRDFLMLGAACDPTKAVETPHTKWAKPYAGGRLRVLCVAEAVRSRDLIELTQRLDVELLTVTGPPISGFTFKNPESFHAMGRRVEEHLAAGNIDCVVIASFGWNLFEESTRSALMEYVRQGGGLLFSAPRCTGAPGEGRHINLGHGIWVGWEDTPEGGPIEALVKRLERVDEEYLTATIPWGLNSHFTAQTERKQPWMLFRGGAVEAGRILLYDLHTDGTYGNVCLTPALCWMASFDLQDYDYAVGVAAKAVLWAAGSASPVRIRSVTYGSDRQFFRKATVGLNGRWRVAVVNLGADPVKAQVRLRARTRRADAPFEAQRGITLKPGLNRIDLPHVMDRIGQVFADVSVLLDGKVTDWATGGVLAMHGNPWFTELSTDQPFYEPGQSPRITAGVALKSYGKSPGQPGLIRWRLLDRWSRLVARGERPFVFNTYDQLPVATTWALPALSEHSLGYELAVDLVRNGKTSDQRVLDLKCRRTVVDDFLFCAWDGTGAPPNCLGAVAMRDRYGLDAVGVNFGDAISGEPHLTTRLSKDALAWANRINLRPWIYACHLGGRFDKQKRRDIDFADPAFRRALRTRLRAVAEIGRPYGPLFYSLGDEVTLGPPEAAASGHEIDAFRVHLQAKYGKIEALNKRWETEYEYWRDIVAPTPKQRAAGGCNQRLITELRRFRDTQFADIVGLGVEAVQDVDPGANVGVEGIFGLTHHYGNFDYAKLCRTSTFMGQYALGMEMDMVRSFQKPGDLLGCWYNYHKLDREYSQFGPWHVLLRGCRSFGWYIIVEGSHYTAFNPDFTLFEQFAWTWEELEPLLGGIGKLVVDLKRDDPGVYVLYEQANLDRHSPSFLSMIVFTTLLRDIGVQHDFLSGEQIGNGALADPRVKALILPRQFMMRKSGAAAVRAFAERGGIVVADEATAAFDGLRWYEKPLLTDIFADSASMKGRPLPQTESELQDWNTHQKTVGKGATLYFGSVAKDYRRDRMREPGQLMRKVLEDFFAEHGIAPTIRARAAAKPFLPIDAVCYRDGDCRYLGLQREYKIVDQSPQPFRVTAPEEAHIYDVRNAKYLGCAAETSVELEVARGALLAFLPYKARSLLVAGLEPAYRQGDRIALRLALQVEGGTPAGGVFRVETNDCNGARVAALCSKVRSAGGVASLELPLAYGDPTGEWQIRATDVVTGLAETRQFTVLPAP